MSRVKGVALATEVERIEFELADESYWIEVYKDPPARVWNELKTAKPNETPFDTDTRVLLCALQEWDLGLDITKEAVNDLTEPVRAAMVHLVTLYYLQLQKAHADLLERIYRPGGDATAPDPTSGAGTASGSRKPSKGSRRTP